LATDGQVTAVQTVTQQSLQIEAKNLTNLPAPALNIGDVVQLAVRQNPVNQAGLVALRGLLINAKLPPGLQPGDKINAQIVKNGDQVIFKILGDILGVNTPQPQAASTPLQKIQNQFQEIFKAASAVNLRSIQPEQLADTLRTAGQLRGTMERLIGNLTKLLPSGERLFTPQELIRELNKAFTGGQVKVLRDLAKDISEFVRQNTPPPPSEPITDLQAQLSKLLVDTAENNSDAANSLKTLVGDLERAVKTPARPITKNERAIIENTLKSLLTAQAGPASEEAGVRPPLQIALLGVQQQLERAVAVAGALDPKTIADLSRLAGQLDQIASAQEALERLNPLLQALGEPAMILFPFLFQGLLSHTEVTVYSRPPKRKGDEDSDVLDGEGGKSGGSQESFRRIQVSAPLPTLGSIDVDVAVRSKEILVRLSVADPEANEFLKTKLDDLAALLKEHGYERAELFSHLGMKKETAPDWSLGLHALHSLFA